MDGALQSSPHLSPGCAPRGCCAAGAELEALTSRRREGRSCWRDEGGGRSRPEGQGCAPRLQPSVVSQCHGAAIAPVVGGRWGGRPGPGRGPSGDGAERGSPGRLESRPRASRRACARRGLSEQGLRRPGPRSERPGSTRSLAHFAHGRRPGASPGPSPGGRTVAALGVARERPRSPGSWPETGTRRATGSALEARPPSWGSRAPVEASASTGPWAQAVKGPAGHGHKTLRPRVQRNTTYREDRQPHC